MPGHACTEPSYVSSHALTQPSCVPGHARVWSLAVWLVMHLLSLTEHPLSLAAMHSALLCAWLHVLSALCASHFTLEAAKETEKHYMSLSLSEKGLTFLLKMKNNSNTNSFYL